MTFLQVVPDEPYFIWQLYVQMQNFRNIGIEQDAVILFAYKPGVALSKEYEDFRKWTKARVIRYPDTRKSIDYRSSIRPHIIKQFVAGNKDSGTFFYHDQDIIFLRYPRVEHLLNDDKIYIGEQAKGYVWTRYLLGFDKYIYYSMCKIVDIDPDIPIQNDPVTGGAQYLMKNTTYEFWDKVEKDCEGLFKYLRDITSIGLTPYNPDIKLPEDHVQIWTADMWALLWNIWRDKKETALHDEMDFSWPWEETVKAKNIIHNAGITLHNEFDKDQTTRLYFHKERYRDRAPFNDDHSYVSKNIAQYEYIKLFETFKDVMPAKVVNNTALETVHASFSNKPSILVILCTNNKVKPLILQSVLKRIYMMKEVTENCEVVTCSWEPIKNNPFTGYITPFRDLGHLNYIFQIKQVLKKHLADIVVIAEHDVLYSTHYLNTLRAHWDKNYNGISYLNYIGMNTKGYQRVKERHEPFSMMSFKHLYLDQLLDQKINECLSRLDDQSWGRYGWACIEPDDKSLMKQLPFTDIHPNIHINDTHHFTGHAFVCYEEEAYTTSRPDWGDYKALVPLMNVSPQLEHNRMGV